MRIPNQLNLKTHKEFARLSFFAFASNVPNLILCLISALTGNTFVIWVDAIVSFGETTHALVAWLVGRKLCKETGDKYNFGVGRLEVFSSFICDLLLIIGLCGILSGSVLGLKNPTLPSDSIWLFCLLKVVNSAFDLYFLIKMNRICREHSSKLNETERSGYKFALTNDVAVGVIVFICFIFRQRPFVLYFSPVSSILLAIYFIWCCIAHVRNSVSEITDVSFEIAEQDNIFDIVLNYSGFYRKINSVNCRRLNNKARIEISLVMKDDLTYLEMQSYLKKLREEIQEVEPESEVVLVIEPLISKDAEDK